MCIGYKNAVYAKKKKKGYALFKGYKLGEMIIYP
jgi:hypothetical protein